jgi:hypothetical protein
MKVVPYLMKVIPYLMKVVPYLMKVVPYLMKVVPYLIKVVPETRRSCALNLISTVLLHDCTHFSGLEHAF